MITVLQRVTGNRAWEGESKLIPRCLEGTTCIILWVDGKEVSRQRKRLTEEMEGRRSQKKKLEVCMERLRRICSHGEVGIFMAKEKVCVVFKRRE